MPKSVDYKVTLHPAKKDGAFIATSWRMFKQYPEKDITAAGMPDLLNQVTVFAHKHGMGCQAHVQCLAARKPPGFKGATTSLYFNLDVNQPVVASAA